MLFLLGLVDVLCALAMVLSLVGYPFFPLQAGAALLLIIKGVFFFGDMLSIIDIIIAVVMFELLWLSMPTIALIIAVYLTIKGLYSFT